MWKVGGGALRQAQVVVSVPTKCWKEKACGNRRLMTNKRVREWGKRRDGC